MGEKKTVLSPEDRVLLTSLVASLPMTIGRPYLLSTSWRTVGLLRVWALAEYSDLPHPNLPCDLSSFSQTAAPGGKCPVIWQLWIIDTPHTEVRFRSFGSARRFTLVDLNLQRCSGITERSIKLPLAGLSGQEPDREWWPGEREGKVVLQPGEPEKGGGMRRWWGRHGSRESIVRDREREFLGSMKWIIKWWGKGFGKERRQLKGYRNTRTMQEG